MLLPKVSSKHWLKLSFSLLLVVVVLYTNFASSFFHCVCTALCTVLAGIKQVSSTWHKVAIAQLVHNETQKSSSSKFYSKVCTFLHQKCHFWVLFSYRLNCQASALFSEVRCLWGNPILCTYVEGRRPSTTTYLPPTGWMEKRIYSYLFTLSLGLSETLHLRNSTGFVSWGN